MNIPKKELEFIKQLREKAKNGDPAFQFQVGLCYSADYYNIEQDYKQAAKWFKLAADQGDARAQNNLGYAFEFGGGVEKDDEQAAKWYKLSAEQKNPIAQYNLAACYEQEKGVTQNYTEAIKFFNLSAEQNFYRALWYLGVMYQKGKGVTQDIEQAKKYYEKALAKSDESDDYWNWPLATEKEKKDIQENIDKIDATLAKSKKEAEAALQAKRTDIFISYAHKDMTETDYMDELKDHLKSLSRTHEIKWWSDRNIKPGEDWKTEIQEAISRAKVAVLMVSARFFASEYIWKNELPQILKDAKTAGAKVLWLPVSYCDYDDKGLDDYQAVIDPKTPLADLSFVKRDKEYMELTKLIKDIFKDTAKQETTTP
jgi:FOG: TPR repeat, SEL1 subfamily